MTPARIAVFLVALIAGVLLTSAPARSAKDPAAAQAKARDKVVDLLLDHAAWCAKKGAVEEGQRALAEARGLDDSAKRLAKIGEQLESAEPADAVADEVARQRKRLGPKLGKAYGKLADAASEAGDGRATDFLVAGLTWDLSSAVVKNLSSRIRKLANDPDAAGRLLAGWKRADPNGESRGQLHKLEADLASEGLLLLGSADHPLVGYVSLPRGWKSGKSYPVLIAVDGAGSNHLGCARNFSKSRGARDVIVLSPATLSNTNELKPEKYKHYAPSLLTEWNAKRLDFDAAGVDALLAILRDRFGAEEKVFLTGFSGGGLFTYHRLLQKPETVAGAAPACANFGGGGLQGAPGAGDGGGPPVHLLTGELDPHRDHVFGQKPGIEGQTDRIQSELARLGYTNVRRTMVKGAKHSALPAKVWEFVDEVLAAR